MATDSPKPMSPTGAVARHLEWLEFALAAARDEEARRKGRLDKATAKNRDKRTVRLAEVSAEVVELSALVTGLKNLRGPGAASATKRRATTRPSTGPRRAGGRPRGTASSVAAASSAGAAATTAPKASAAAPKAAPARKAAPKPRAASASKPRAASVTKPRATTARKTTRAASKPSTARTRKPRPATATAPASPTAEQAPTGPTV